MKIRDWSFIGAVALLSGATAMLVYWVVESAGLTRWEVPLAPPTSSMAQAEEVEIEQPQFHANANNSRAAEREEGGALIVPDIASLAAELNAPEFTVEHDLEIIQTIIEFYRTSNNGQNPTGGLNEEIVDALRGKNSRHFAVLPEDLPAVNAAGQLVDRWGSPYFFHPISSTVLEVRSPGPDKRLWTADDVLESESL